MGVPRPHKFPILPLPSSRVMGYGATEATSLGFVFVVINPRVLSANRVDLGFFVS